MIAPDNLFAPLVALEQAEGVLDVAEVVEHLTALLAGSKFDSLRRAFTVYLVRVLRIAETAPEVSLQDLVEVKQMLAELPDTWINRGIEQGMQAGRQEGIEEGMQKGMQVGFHDMLNIQLTDKFGPLSPRHQALLNSLSADDMLEVSKRVLHADSLDDIFKGH